MLLKRNQIVFYLGYGIPWLMIVDSSATIGSPRDKALCTFCEKITGYGNGELDSTLFFTVLSLYLWLNLLDETDNFLFNCFEYTFRLEFVIM